MVFRFTYVDVGAEGRVGDAGVWNRSKFKAEIISNDIGFPSAECLPKAPDGVSVPYHIIGDSAFQLATFMMKPYSQAAINTDINKRIFNYRLSRARRCVENAFGILTHRFEIFRAPIRTTVASTDHIVLACIALHNWLMTDRMLRESYCPPGLTDEEDILSGTVTPGHFRNDPSSKGLLPIVVQGSNRSTQGAQEQRDYICNYFASSYGSRAWQNDKI